MNDSLLDNIFLHDTYWITSGLVIVRLKNVYENLFVDSFQVIVIHGNKSLQQHFKRNCKCLRFFLNGIISLNERLLQDELMCYWLIRLKWEFDNFYLFLDERIVTRAKDYQSSKWQLAGSCIFSSIAVRKDFSCENRNK